MGKDPDQIRREIEDTRDRMGDTVDALAYKADVPNRVKDNIADRVGGAKSAIGGAATKLTSAVTGTAGRVTDSVGEKLPDADDVRHGAERTVSMIKENPLGVLLSGVAAGFLIGSLLPKTDLEDERLGELSDNLKSQAKNVGSQALEHSKTVLRETAEAAKDSAQAHAQEFAQTMPSIDSSGSSTNYVNPATE